ncbi:hypothetical protein FF100_18800 [Methylobacterium terricola]|uniref:Thymidylate synthase/dCMP hydroxymethylase domain-containing protein n=1 Tax=Methylobacterium terricola TaxID=2583531 RepID=A0A5C4LFZ6_9HYPH|nr:thymidylate synthase [Methylobacterium terricola]TNC11688.1 hypothetical protein FF100_18800 [Methylobacterium terricola]
MSRPSRNVSFATVDGLEAVMRTGSPVTVAGKATREILHRVTILERPLERFVFVPERRNDAFAQMAEAVWVIAGRNDVEWLGRYLPRATDFSNDGGSTWRGAYGPRLRRWNGSVDQFEHVRRLLMQDRSSRRAVMNLFDPAIDLSAVDDIPCNNWLSWILRNGHLHLAVAVRSNDAVWGFSGANAFEWSLLHEIMAHWLGAKVGRQTWLATSFHVYEQHWPRAERILRSFHGLSPYDYGLETPRFATPWETFAEVLGEWFEVEASVSADPEAPLPACAATADPLLASWLAAIRIRWGAQGWPEGRLRRELAALPATDAAAAVWEHQCRAFPERLEALTDPRLAAYFAATAASAPAADLFKQAVKSLHARKDRAYGAAWKRRGELVSVLPNIARKVDRLQVVLDRGNGPGEEAALDTALDLYVYATKYRLLLAEQEPSSALLPADAPRPLSNHEANFDALVDADPFHAPDADPALSIRNVVDIFERLWPLAGDGGNLPAVIELVNDLRDAARAALAAIASSQPRDVAALIAEEAALSAVGKGAP